MKKTLRIVGLPLGVTLFVAGWVALFVGAGVCAIAGVRRDDARPEEENER
ncbi:MAG: hypothetical protein K0Q71_2145 [Thermomicrobiales bacterium]|jgi:hypothetical protein|nr:hypothetical protein [Thermomicrobiales bacterium]